ncbi:zwei Ig domain protein zig-8-like [Cylas formicarius]|uniref:zwei Ig domain protein zig-8-like n=1 Tax=Cylas formicarius TaxID=197179 RepID=UPI002958468B|nr:zwei Ig domain protein zig-8-like [Cylas formicarius]
MNHRVKKAFPILLVLYEIIATSKAAESIEAIPPTTLEHLTISPEVTTMVPEVERKKVEPRENLSKHDHPDTTKIELGATSITMRQRHGNGHNPNRVVIPAHFHLSDSRFGPFFEEGSEVTNVTARIGSTINLDCRIGLLGDKTVTWTHQRNQSINLLTVGRNAYSKDERIHLAFRYPNNYRLQISYVTRRDDGMYECQVATHPPKIKRIYLKITAPVLKIVDESGRRVFERYYRAGSTLLLTCSVSSIGFSENGQPDRDIISWKHGDRVLHVGSSLNISKETDSAVSTLTIMPLEKSHSGNYTCSVGNLAETTVTVHVLNGELPAAVQTAGVRTTSISSCVLSILLCISMFRR